LAPLQSLTHGRGTLRCHTLPRFVVPTAQPIHEDLPLPVFAFPGHVTSVHLPCASTHFSLHGLPGVLSTRRARGTPPSELDRTKIAGLLSLASPLAIGEPEPRKADNKAYLEQHLPGIGGHKDQLVEQARRPVPSGSRVLKRATSAQGISARRGLASGVCSLCRLETSFPDFSFHNALALLAFTLPGAFPFPCPEPQRPQLPLAGQPRPLSVNPTLPPHSPLGLAFASQALQERSRAGSYSLCFRVSKSREVGVTSSEVAGP